MNIIELATRRPVAISMLTLAVLLFGFVSLSRLEVTLLPNLSYPTLTVRSELPGAAPTEIETLLSKPVEEALGVIKNVRQVRSVSQAGRSDVTLEFNWGTKMDFAVLDVREKLDALVLPKEAQRPIVLRFDPSQDPIVRLGLSLKQGAAKARDADLKRLRRVAEQQVQKMLEGVPGVAAVKISGGLEDQVQVLADLAKLSQLNLTLETVAARLSAENANISGGRVDEGTLSYLVRTLNQFKNLDEIRDTVVATRDGRPVYVRDVAEVHSGFREREAIIRIDGQEAVEIALYKEGDSNAVTVAKAALARAETVRKALPGDLALTTLYDQSVFIQQAIREVMHAAIEGGLLAILVLYLFLRNAWITAVIGVAIPISVIATFNVMYGAGVSLNIMSLGGIALAIGLLVDDAIVVLENITRKHEQGMPLGQATVTGAREVVAAVTASTLTTVAVFFPMVFVQGIAGQLFADQALVVTGSLIFSLIVSFTVTPMLVAREARTTLLVPARPARSRGEVMGAPLPPPSKHLPTFGPWLRPLRPVARALAWFLGAARHFVFELLVPWVIRPLLWVFGGLAWALGFVLRPAAAAWQRGYQKLENRYVPLLEWSLAHRGPVLGTAALMFGLSLLLLTRIGVELLPPFTQGEFRTEITLAPGTPLERTDEVLQKLSARMHGQAAVAANYSVAGTGNRLDASAETGGESFGVLNLALQPGAYDQEAALIGQLRQPLDAMPGVSYRFTRPTLFTLKTPLEVEIAGYDLEGIGRVADQVRARMLASDRYTEVATTLKPGHPELQVVFDQERAAALNLNTADLASRVARAVQGTVATRYRLEDREIDVLVRAGESDRHNVEAIRNLVINPDSTHPVTLQAVAEVAQRSGPSEIRRADQQRVVVLSANLVYGDLGEAVTDLKETIGHVALPPGVTAEVAGQSQEMKVSFRSLQLALALAVFLVYLVMASEFESLVHPFVILFTIPLAGIGAILALYLTNSVINVIALIGMIMLAGIVVKNGIVLIDLVNRLRDEGMDRTRALLEGGRARLRPILMTTLTAILGLLPMAIGGGEGAEVRAPMAITVIGGLLVSTILTLVVIPVIYTLLDRDEPAAELRPAVQE
ncbi:MAG TPA: efflux RND transporter permease subunit [Candidatus Binatia bacterium]|nr:efflux RND transporter permease subunit [Candidatus Binatia bacterium]